MPWRIFVILHSLPSPSPLIQPSFVVYYIAYCLLSTLANGFQVEWFIMFRQTDRQAPFIPLSRSLTRGMDTHSHAPQRILQSSLPCRTIAPKGDYPDFISGLCHPSVCVSLCWRKVGTGPTMLCKWWWQSTLRKLEGSSWGLPVLEFDWWILLQRGSHLKLISSG